MENRKKSNAIAVIAILFIILLAVLAGTWIFNFTNDAFSYDIMDEWEDYTEEIAKQTEDFKKRAEEAKKNYEDAMKYLE